MGPSGGRVTDLRSLPPVCQLTAALPLALVPRNCNPASPELLLLLFVLLRVPTSSSVLHASGRTSVPLDPAALLPALRCHVKRRQGTQVRRYWLGAFCLLAFSPPCRLLFLAVFRPLHSRGALKTRNRRALLRHHHHHHHHHLDLHENKLRQKGASVGLMREQASSAAAAATDRLVSMFSSRCAPILGDT